MIFLIFFDFFLIFFDFFVFFGEIHGILMFLPFLGSFLVSFPLNLCFFSRFVVVHVICNCLGAKFDVRSRCHIRFGLFEESDQSQQGKLLFVVCLWGGGGYKNRFLTCFRPLGSQVLLNQSSIT